MQNLGGMNSIRTIVGTGLLAIGNTVWNYPTTSALTGAFFTGTFLNSQTTKPVTDVASDYLVNPALNAAGSAVLGLFRKLGVPVVKESAVIVLNAVSGLAKEVFSPQTINAVLTREAPSNAIGPVELLMEKVGEIMPTTNQALAITATAMTVGSLAYITHTYRDCIMNYIKNPSESPIPNESSADGRDAVYQVPL